jgi:replicative DNA helicase
MSTELKTPPHSDQAERALLSAVFNDPAVLAELGGRLTAEMFYQRENRFMFAAVTTVAATGKPVDAITVSEQLSDAGELHNAGGLEYLADIASAAGSRNAPRYAEIIRGKYLERRLIQAAHTISAMGYDGTDPVEQRLAAAQSELLAIMDSSPDSGPVHINESMQRAVAAIEDRYNRGGEFIGVPSGFKDLDEMVGGFKPGEMILVAGRPSMGKSTLAQNFIENAVVSGKHVLFFSVEMPQEMVSMRHLSSLGGVNLESLVQARIKDLGDEIVNAAAKMRNRHYHIDDTPSLISSQILLRAQRMQMKTGKPLDLIVVDYIQKLRDPGDNQNTRVQEISGNIKHAARVLNCPVIALSQLSRECEKRNDKRPMLSDLRDSGSLEQDADVVMFIYRDEVYNKTEEFRNVAELLVRKNRNGRTGDCILTSRLHLARFENHFGPRPTKKGANSDGFE